jgi:hypothetical protein
MKKITLMLFLIFSVLGFGQFPTPGTEGFENTTGPDVATNPSAWTLGTGATGNQWAVFDNGVGTTKRWTFSTTTGYPHGGTQAAFCDREAIGQGNTSEDYLATPLITVPANGQLRFWTRTTINTDNGSLFFVKLAPSTATQTNIAAYTTTLQQWTETTLTATYNVYEEKVVDLSAYAGTQVYLAFMQQNTQNTTSTSGDRWVIDDVSLVAQCLDPTNLSASGLTFNSAQLSWTPNGSTSWEIEVVPATGTPTGVGTPYSGTLPYAVSGLLSNTCYNYYVRANCAGGILSNWAGPFNFCTTISPTVGCGGNFTDPGGPTGNYANNANVTTVICPTNPGDLVTITFTSFNLEAGFDFLKVYDGNSNLAKVKYL